jgi:CopG antitoxin of type II toxin-antitoxin system
VKKTSKKAVVTSAIAKPRTLLTAHVPTPVYEEVRRRANAERRSISQFVALFLESALTPVKGA